MKKNEIYEDHNYLTSNKFPFDLDSYDKLCFDSCSDMVHYNALLQNCVHFNIDSAIKCINGRKNNNHDLSNVEILTACSASEKTEEYNDYNIVKPNKLTIDYVHYNNLLFDYNSISTYHFSVNSNNAPCEFDSECENTDHSDIHSNVKPINVYFNFSDVNVNTFNRSEKTEECNDHIVNSNTLPVDYIHYNYQSTNPIISD